VSNEEEKFIDDDKFDVEKELLKVDESLSRDRMTLRSDKTMLSKSNVELLNNS
jgi:hypothetical protein